LHVHCEAAGREIAELKGDEMKEELLAETADGEYNGRSKAVLPKAVFQTADVVGDVGT